MKKYQDYPRKGRWAIAAQQKVTEWVGYRSGVETDEYAALATEDGKWAVARVSVGRNGYNPDWVEFGYFEPSVVEGGFQAAKKAAKRELKRRVAVNPLMPALDGLVRSLRFDAVIKKIGD